MSIIWKRLGFSDMYSRVSITETAKEDEKNGSLLKPLGGTTVLMIIKSTECSVMDEKVSGKN